MVVVVLHKLCFTFFAFEFTRSFINSVLASFEVFGGFLFTMAPLLPQPNQQHKTKQNNLVGVVL